MPLSSQKTDEQIASEVQAGDAESFGLLVERYEQKIKRYARKFLSDGEDIKDLVQDVFIKAYINMRSFDAERRFSPWIYRIAHNEFINAMKKKKRDPLFFFDLDVLFPHPIAPEVADRDANHRELKTMLEQDLSELSPKYREPLVLYYLQDLDYKEIAEVLQIPISTVGVRLARGKAALRVIAERHDKAL